MSLFDSLIQTLSTGLTPEATAADNAPIELSELRILDKQQHIVTLLPKRAQADFLAHMTGRDLVLKARQLGFSTIIQADLFTTAVSQSARIGTLAHDDEATQKLRDMQQMFYNELPDARKPERSINNATRTYFPQTNSMVYIGTAGNTTQGRAGTYSHVHGSEVAFWKDAKQVMAGMLQGVPAHGRIVLESTPNGAAGWFYDRCMEALKGESEWTLHFYEWWWDDDYQLPLDPEETIIYTPDEKTLVDKHRLKPEQIKWRRKKQRELGDLFTQEYPEDPVTCFLTSGASAFPNVHMVMDGPKQAKPEQGHEYVAGLDWGQDNDYTSLSIFDRTTKEEVYLNRWRREPYKVIRGHVLEACQFWNVREITPERNSMSTNVEALIDDFEARRYPISVNPLVMSNTVKHELVSLFKQGYQEQGMTLLDDDYARQEMNIFVKKQTPALLWTYAAEGDGHDDTVIARLLAWQAVNNISEIIFAQAPQVLQDIFGGFG